MGTSGLYYKRVKFVNNASSSKMYDHGHCGQY
jgi:hypothetical protein